MKNALTILCLLVFASIDRAQKPTIEAQKLVSDNGHVVTYERKGDLAVFTLESISDFTDETGLDHKFTSRDLAGMTVDINSNNRVDKNIDVAYEIGSGSTTLCTQYLYGVGVSSVCGVFKSSATLDISFFATSHESRPHPVFKFSIPIREIFGSGSTVGIVFEFWTAGVGRTTYPELDDEWQTLKRTITVTR